MAMKSWLTNLLHRQRYNSLRGYHSHISFMDCESRVIYADMIVDDAIKGVQSYCKLSYEICGLFEGGSFIDTELDLYDFVSEAGNTGKTVIRKHNNIFLCFRICEDNHARNNKRYGFSSRFWKKRSRFYSNMVPAM